MVIALIGTGLVAVIFLVLYMDKRQDCKLLQRDNTWLREQRSTAIMPEDKDAGPLTPDLVMEALRQNGFVPEMDGVWILFRSEGESYYVNVERLPIFCVMKIYSLDLKQWNIDLLRRTAHELSDELIMVKVFFRGENEDELTFHVASVENKYGHLKDCLWRYMEIIRNASVRFREIYHKLEQESKQDDVCKISLDNNVKQILS